MNNRFLLLCNFLTAFFYIATGLDANSQSKGRDIYELKIYHIEDSGQEKQIDEFLSNAYLPALKRAGIPEVGVFKPVKDNPDYGKKIYVYIPYKSIKQFMEVPKKLEKDKKYNADGRGYLDAVYNNPPYNRIETILLQAFEGMPRYKANNLKGPSSEKIYELRSYEGATEKLYKKKVEMFNKGETDIFHRLGFNPMFFGEVIAGSRMPNLMYLTTFSDKASRDAHWDAFRSDKKWEEMKAMKEYQNTVSHSDIIFLHPASYSTL